MPDMDTLSRPTGGPRWFAAVLGLALCAAAPAGAQAALDGPAAAPPVSERAGTPAVFRPDLDRVRALGGVDADARDFTVRGRVISADDRQPLPGVNVVVEGTTIGIATNAEGRYDITAPSETDSLRFSFIGFETQTIPILGREQINVTLRPESYQGDEVVVIGYGTTEVRDLTGAVGSISSEDIEGKPLISFEDALSGRVAGVQVQQNSGDQLGNFSVNVRGVGSPNGSNRPLYILDGIPLEAADVAFLGTINTQDIESISVLKDASSASIYGTRAADGVVIITTKTGAGREPQVQLSVETGTQSPIKTLDMLNSAQLAEFRRDAVRNSQGDNPTFTLPAPLQDPQFLAANDVDWQDEVLRTGLTQRYNASVLGSSGPVQFSGSANYENREGTLLSTDVQKASVRLNAITQIGDRATVDFRLNGARQWANVVTNDRTFGANFRDALYKYPWEQPYDPDGSFAAYQSDDPEINQIFSSAFPQNPVANLLEVERYRQYQQFISNVALTYELPFNVEYRGSASANLSVNTADNFVPTSDRARQQRETISVESNEQNAYNYFTDQTLRFDGDFGAHNVEALGGFSFQTSYNEFTYVNAGGGTNNRQREIAQQPEIIGASGGRQPDNVLVSYFSRLNYSYADKYFVTGTVRRDGSSTFSPDRKWAVFPALGLSWRLSSEPFMERFSAISDLKLRASYGELGDRGGVPIAFAYLNLVTNGQFVGFGDEAVPAVWPRNIAIEDGISWEIVRQFDVGLDLLLFRGRLGLTLDGYVRNTDNVLGQVTAPPAFVTGSVIGNFGAVRNRGFEVALNTTPVNGGPLGLNWRLDATFGYNENTVTELGEGFLGESAILFGRGVDGPIGRNGTRSVNRTEVGRSIGEFWVWEFDGICSTTQYDEASNSCNGIEGIRPGDTLYRDLDGNGVIDDDDRSFQGQGIPKMFGGVTSALSVGAFELETLFTYAIGRKLLDTSLQFGISGDSNINKRAEVLDRWTPENQDTDIPRAFQGPQGYNNVRPSTFFLQSADFLRLRTLTLTYRLPEVYAGMIGARGARLSLIGSNLLTFTGYSGFDPEASSGQRSDSGNIEASSAPLSPGLDFTTYPISKSIALRLNVTL